MGEEFFNKTASWLELYYDKWYTNGLMRSKDYWYKIKQEEYNEIREAGVETDPKEELGFWSKIPAYLNLMALSRILLKLGVSAVMAIGKILATALHLLGYAVVSIFWIAPYNIYKYVQHVWKQRIFSGYKLKYIDWITPSRQGNSEPIAPKAAKLEKEDDYILVYDKIDLLGILLKLDIKIDSSHKFAILKKGQLKILRSPKWDVGKKIQAIQESKTEAVKIAQSKQFLKQLSSSDFKLFIKCLFKTGKISDIQCVGQYGFYLALLMQIKIHLGTSPYQGKSFDGLKKITDLLADYCKRPNNYEQATVVLDPIMNNKDGKDADAIALFTRLNALCDDATKELVPVNQSVAQQQDNSQEIVDNKNRIKPVIKPADQEREKLIEKVHDDKENNSSKGKVNVGGKYDEVDIEVGKLENMKV